MDLHRPDSNELMRIPCDSCGEDVTQDKGAHYKILVPEGKTVEEAPASFVEAAQEGYSIGVICSQCQLKDEDGDN